MRWNDFAEYLFHEIQGDYLTAIGYIRQTSLGLWLVIIGTAIAVAGVYSNNVLLDHYQAMVIWRWSNVIFVVYFFSRWRKWIDGGLSDFIMFCLYLFYVVTNEWGLEQYG